MRPAARRTGAGSPCGAPYPRGEDGPAPPRRGGEGTRRARTASRVASSAARVSAYVRCAAPTNRQSTTVSCASRLAIAPQRNVVSRAAVVSMWLATRAIGDCAKLVSAIVVAPWARASASASIGAGDAGVRDAEGHVVRTREGHPLDAVQLLLEVGGDERAGPDTARASANAIFSTTYARSSPGPMSLPITRPSRPLPSARPASVASASRSCG